MWKPFSVESSAFEPTFVYHEKTKVCQVSKEKRTVISANSFLHRVLKIVGNLMAGSVSDYKRWEIGNREIDYDNLTVYHRAFRFVKVVFINVRVILAL